MNISPILKRVFFVICKLVTNEYVSYVFQVSYVNLFGRAVLVPGRLPRKTNSNFSNKRRARRHEMRMVARTKYNSKHVRGNTSKCNLDRFAARWSL